MDQLNLFEFDTPGIYKIVCQKTNCTYYGQTSCFLRRCFEHLQQLQNGSHPCKSLQHDFNLYSRDNFTFKILSVEYSLQQRLKYENTMIKNTAEKYLYNPKAQTQIFKYQPRIAQKIQIDEIVYPSIAEASRQLNRSSRILRKYLDDPIKQNYKRLDFHRHNYFDEYQVIIEGKLYSTTHSVVKKGLAKTTRQVRDRGRSKKWPKWILVKRMSNDYPIRE